MNTKFTETEHGPGLKAEAWLDEGRMNVIDERIPAAIENGEMMELSTGLYSNNEKTPGTFRGKHYDAIVRNMIADHLALLPDLKGACSIEDGAGFLRLNAKDGAITMTTNEMSHGNIRSLLNSWLQEKKGTDESYPFVEDVFDNFFIVEDGGKFYKRDYTLTEDNTVEISKDEPIEVIRKTEWVDLEGNFIGNFGSANSVETPLMNPGNFSQNRNQESTSEETPLIMPSMDDEVDETKKTISSTPDYHPVGDGVFDTPETEPLQTPKVFED